ncbi:glycosyltransferase family 9 protein [Edaphobacter sp. 12200R-103]|uniref:glycosyltransferase family 9 protein n=1 Tax=Edaphobacter sp. 12200R-103 TaxID=2703788 RepID=UPI00138C13AD|nr:glycosyltransferase family 9 protein [Edaphobacter sp. 12200R-103]QHS51671.1 glycosyltransferase family 9 protein [Edaphobacter sp. 12200R-103]
MSLINKLKGTACAGVMALESGIGRSTRFHEIENFIVFQHAPALGTVIHTTPLFSALKCAVPAARITVVASGFSVEALRNNPNIENLVVTPNPISDLKSSVQLLRRQFPFRNQKFATLFPLGNERMRVTLQAVLSGASSRVGFAVQPALYRIPLEFDKARSQIANNLRIAEALGHAAPHVEPRIFFSEQDEGFALELLAGSGVNLSKPVAVFVTQTSVTQRKSWRPERFRKAAAYLKDRHDAQIIFIGTTAESKAIEELRSGLSFATVNLAGQTNLPQLTALMSLCTVGLTLDTGPLHIGRAAGLPMVVIAPAWSPPIEWLPVNNERFRIFKNADLPTAPPDYIIDEVSVDDVTSALEDLLARFGEERLRLSAAKALQGK